MIGGEAVFGGCISPIQLSDDRARIKRWVSGHLTTSATKSHLPSVRLSAVSNQNVTRVISSLLRTSSSFSPVRTRLSPLSWLMNGVATMIIYFIAIIMNIIMIYHIRSKYTAVGTWRHKTVERRIMVCCRSEGDAHIFLHVHGPYHPGTVSDNWLDPGSMA